MSAFIDITGRVFGRLTVLGLETRRPRARWKCRCVCGSECSIDGSALKMGNTSSCGCLRRETSRAIGRSAKTHGHSKSRGGKPTPTYKTWIAMWARCGNPRHHNFPSYGARGIAVCDRWSDFDAFLADMGPRPPGTTVDRIDVNGNYEPGNCRWATAAEQNRNRRDTHRVTVGGVTKCVSEWARSLGMRPKSIYQRIHNGWTDVEAVTVAKRGRTS